MERMQNFMQSTFIIRLVVCYILYGAQFEELRKKGEIDSYTFGTNFYFRKALVVLVRMQILKKKAGGQKPKNN